MVNFDCLSLGKRLNRLNNQNMYKAILLLFQQMSQFFGRKDMAFFYWMVFFKFYKIGVELHLLPIFLFLVQCILYRESFGSL